MNELRVVGINFDHMHMGDNLRMVHEHPHCEIAGVCDSQPERMNNVVRNFALADHQIYTDYRKCIEEAKPDLIVLCPATAHHGTWTEQVAPYGKPILMEKPFAASLDEANQMISVCREHGVVLAINWPLAWYPPHRTAKRMIDDGIIGDPIEVHFYDGNRGPLWHAADKVEITAETVAQEKPSSWFYNREAGGGSMLDYLGYGTTLGTWFLNGRKPLEVTSTIDQPAGLDVDEHSVTVARYEFGLSKYETRWGTYTDPWTHQPQPKCGFVIVGTAGTISAYDYESTVRVQTASEPDGKTVEVDRIESPYENPIQYMYHCLINNQQVEGPLSIETSLIGQQIVDTAFQSALEKRTLPFPVD